jgi:hypothetical protein
MPNALNAHTSTKYKILMLGTTGAGKTTQFLTLPGKKFIYLFDPNGILSLQGYDIDYEEFLPDVMNLDVVSLKKADGRQPISVMRRRSPDTYRNWEKDFEKKIEDGFFNDYDWIGMDSFTTFSDLVMDEVLRINNRPDSWPQQDDYGPQMLSLKNVVRTFASLDKHIYFTGHMEMKQDALTKKITNTPIMTGRLKATLPLLFSEIFVATATGSSEGDVSYSLQCTPTRDTPLIRTSIKGLEAFEDVTLDFTKPLANQGLGKILTKEVGK